MSYKRTLVEFADQVAIAVHNMLLLRRTDEALARASWPSLSVGREIQLSLLPKVTPTVPGWQFAAMYEAARTVGGDFYDFCELPGPPASAGRRHCRCGGQGRAGRAVHGGQPDDHSQRRASPAAARPSALMRANQLILADSQADLFLSAIYLVLETDNGRGFRSATRGTTGRCWYRAADRAAHAS